MKNQKVGNFIATLRKEKKLTQKDLANKLGITDRAVSKWERGICLPDIMLFEELGNILNVSVTELLKGERIEKNKGISEKDVVSVMTNVEMNVKNKYKSTINTILIFVAVLILLLVGFNILKPFYYINKSYKSKVESTLLIIENVKNKIELIKNH